METDEDVSHRNDMDQYLKSVVTVFNHKGGVGKTSTVIGLGWRLAEEGHKVLLVDADPQCNLTGYLVDPGFELAEEKFQDIDWETVTDPIAQFYSHDRTKNANIFRALAPKLADDAGESAGLRTDVFQVASRTNFFPGTVAERWHKAPQPPSSLYLLGGHPDFGDYDARMSLACENSEAFPNAKDVPGCILALLRQIQRSQVRKGEDPFDHIIFDLSPGATVTNKLIILSSTFLLIPCSMDYFSSMAAESIAKLLPAWDDWLQTRSSGPRPDMQGSDFTLWERKPIFLGHTLQLFTVYNGAPAKAFAKWKDRINRIFREQVLPALESRGMCLDADAYLRENDECQRCEIRSFQSLGACALRLHIPVGGLTADGLKFATPSDLRDSKDRILPSIHQAFEELAHLLEVYNDVHQLRNVLRQQRAATAVLRSNFLNLEEFRSLSPKQVRDAAKVVRDSMARVRWQADRN